MFGQGRASSIFLCDSPRRSPCSEGMRNFPTALSVIFLRVPLPAQTGLRGVDRRARRPEIGV
jgi:hypothetical protein